MMISPKKQSQSPKTIWYIPEPHSLLNIDILLTWLFEACVNKKTNIFYWICMLGIFRKDISFNAHILEHVEIINENPLYAY